MALWRQDLESPFPALVLKVVHTLLSQAHSLCLTTEESHWGRTSHDLSKQVGRPSATLACLSPCTFLQSSSMLGRHCTNLSPYLC